MKRMVLLAALLCLGAAAFGLKAGVRLSFGYGGFLGPGYPPYEEAPFSHYLDRVCFLSRAAAAFLTLGDPLALQLEALYLRLGAALREATVAPRYTQYYRADYLAAAALLKHRYHGQSLLAGPMLLLRIRPGRGDELSPLLFAGACGMDCETALGRGRLVLELRWLYSFTSFFRPGFDDWHPYAYLVSLGYLFARGR
jgi:hypothetical protein